MSFLAGTISGALVAGGVYYGFSNLIRSQTELQREEMHDLTLQLSSRPMPPAPLPAAARVSKAPTKSLLQSAWNDQLAGLFSKATELERDTSEFTRRWLYGGAR